MSGRWTCGCGTPHSAQLLACQRCGDSPPLDEKVRYVPIGYGKVVKLAKTPHPPVYRDPYADDRVPWRGGRVHIDRNGNVKEPSDASVLG